MHEDDLLKRNKTLTRVRLRKWAERGWIMPADGKSGYCYTEIDVSRCGLISQLRDELEVDREAVPIILSLLDQVYGLRRQLRAIVRVIDELPEDIRSDIQGNLTNLDPS